MNIHYKNNRKFPSKLFSDLTDASFERILNKDLDSCPYLEDILLNNKNIFSFDTSFSRKKDED